jgi:hypothetical protein
VRNANDPYHDDVKPTLWRGRIAWTRVYGSGKGANPVVYTKTLTAPRSRPSTRLPGVPQRRCAEPGILGPGRVCEPTTDRAVEALELWRDTLAMIVRYACRGCAGIVSRELRLDDLDDRTARQVALLTSGLAAQALIGPSFFAGRLAWYKACQVPEPACRTAVVPSATRCPRADMRRAAPARWQSRASPTTARGSTRTSAARPRRLNPPARTAGSTRLHRRATRPPARRWAADPRGREQLASWR